MPLAKIFKPLANCELIRLGKFNDGGYLVGKSSLEKSKFLVWFGETESQSMAQFQAWAMDVPTLVLRVEKYNDGESSYNASSSPYLNSETGEFFDSGLPSHNVINSWLDRLNTFSPRNWILKGHTLIYAKNKLEKIYESLNYQSN